MNHNHKGSKVKQNAAVISHHVSGGSVPRRSGIENSDWITSLDVYGANLSGGSSWRPYSSVRRQKSGVRTICLYVRSLKHGYQTSERLIQTSLRSRTCHLTLIPAAEDGTGASVETFHVMLSATFFLWMSLACISLPFSIN